MGSRPRKGEEYPNYTPHGVYGTLYVLMYVSAMTTTTTTTV